MNGFSLESLGFTKAELQQRVIDQIVEQIMHEPEEDEDGGTFLRRSEFRVLLDKQIKAHIDATVSRLAEQHVLPNVSQYIENLCLVETNTWGEKVKEPVTFIEYLVKRAEAYLTEKVSFEGKAKSEANGYSWSGTQSRVTYLINRHLHYSIETAMKDAVAKANAVLVSGLQETAKIKLAEIAQKLTVTVK